MPFRVLLPMATYPDATPAAGLLRAFDIACTLGASVTPVVHEVDIPDVRSLLGHTIIDVPEMIAVAEQRSRRHAAELTEAANVVARRFAMTVTTRRWRGPMDRAPSYLAQIARTFDHTFLVPAGGSWDQRDVTEGVLFGSGGPVWIFPAGESTGHLETVAIAWDGGRAAARALHDALPVLSHSRHVVILSAMDDKPLEDLPLQDLREFLDQRGFEVSVEQFSRGERTIGVALQEAALQRGAGLLVMGAYGHHRLREFVLGGATRDVLVDRQLPVLMSH